MNATNRFVRSAMLVNVALVLATAISGCTTTLRPKAPIARADAVTPTAGAYPAINKHRPWLLQERKKGWHILHSRGMPNQPQTQGDGFTFDFPNEYGTSVHYVVNYSVPLKGKTHLTARFTITGGGFLVRYAREIPTLGIIIGRKGDDGQTPKFRWFSHAAQVLEAGSFKMTVPLDTTGMSDVMGGSEGLADALANHDYVGFVFGSASGRGHGVRARQPSRFVLHSLE